MEKEAINKTIASVTGISGDFFSDLNAMHEAEKTLTPIQLTWMSDYLRALCFPSFRATAAQHAEAFLRTIGKWEDGK